MINTLASRSGNYSFEEIEFEIAKSTATISHINSLLTFDFDNVELDVCYNIPKPTFKSDDNVYMYEMHLLVCFCVLNLCLCCPRLLYQPLCPQCRKHDTQLFET